MLSKIQQSMIIEATKRHKTILPIGRKSSHDQKSFTEHTDRYGFSWIYFWYDTSDNSSHMIKKQTSCPQCYGRLKFSELNKYGHCTQCERRGQ